MVKTRSQTGNITVKKEDEEDVKPTLGLENVRDTRSSDRISKRIPPVTNNGSLRAQQVKVEEDTDTKSLLKSSSKYSKSGKRQDISQEQISQLIDYIVNDNMSVHKASRKVNISHPTGLRYYNVYKNNPEKKIPVPQNRYMHPRKYYTQEQIANLIKHVDDDKMTVKEASAKADINFDSGRYYHNKYLEDPNHNIPIARPYQTYTQDQREAFIHYVISDKMSIKAASRKAGVNNNTGKTYYRNYFKVQNPDIPKPSHIATRKCYTQEQIKEVISCIVDDNMSINAASKKANITPYIAGIHYQQYLKGNNTEVIVGKYSKRYAQHKINQLINYVENDKMSIRAASKKANLTYTTSHRHYHQYLNDRERDTLTRRP
jgi:transposase